MNLQINSRKTFGSVLRENDGAGPGFDLLRLALSLAIMASHCSSMSGTRGFLSALMQEILNLIWPTHGSAPLQEFASGAVLIRDNTSPAVNGLARPYTLSHVPMFFALSGFLVTGSAFRTKRVLPFLGLRFFRIFPALCVEVVLSAIVLGAFFTTLPLDQYYTSPNFFAYFQNILGIVHLFLPGVSFNGSPVVNSNLWTLPAEFYSYLITAVLIVTGFLFSRTIFTSMFSIVTFFLFFANVFFGYQLTNSILPGNVNVYYFFMGALLYMWRDRIVYSWWLFIACTVATYFLMFSQRAVYVYPILLTYITVFIGLSPIPTNRLLRSGDYSYGIYLYGFPISQTLVSSFPALQGNLPGLLFSSIFVTGVFACLSWHLVEKRFLRLRRLFSPESAKIALELHPDAPQIEPKLSESR
jgi:peptidoglycan/LPS O-acetylase OafA/YrhL